MKGQVYNPLEDPSSDTVASRFVLIVLIQAASRQAEKIHFRRLSDSPGNHCDIAVYFERDGTEEPVDHPPMKVWRNVISKLKVISGMVDYGPIKSEDGYINFQLSKNRTAVFYLPENPNPHTANEVTLIYKGTQS
jgi:type II secretory ATPase GspE/PulE/Tfp pilus assembly ATPase PilB-like protein